MLISSLSLANSYRKLVILSVTTLSLRILKKKQKIAENGSVAVLTCSIISYGEVCTCPVVVPICISLPVSWNDTVNLVDYFGIIFDFVTSPCKFFYNILAQIFFGCKRLTQLDDFRPHLQNFLEILFSVFSKSRVPNWDLGFQNL